jgi:hypothetical protein
MHQQLWGYKVEWKGVSRGTGGKKVEYHWTRLWTGRPGFNTRQGQGIFLFATTVSRPILEPIQPIKWELGALSPRVKRPAREADHSPPSSAEVKNAWSYTSTPYVFMAWFVVKYSMTSWDRDNFAFTLLYHLLSWRTLCLITSGAGKNAWKLAFKCFFNLATLAGNTK